MKKLYFLLFTLLISTTSFGQTTVFQESFETGNSATASETCNDSSGDFFTVTDGTDISSSYVVTGGDGSYFFAAQDTDGAPCTSATETLLFDDIDISTYTNLTLAILLAEDDSSDGNEDWDGGDLFYIEVDYDNSGTFTKVMQFATIATTGFNVSAPMLDSNFDDIGEGAALTPAFTEFTSALGTGSLIDVRLVFDGLAAGDEDIAVDNIRIIDSYAASPTISVTAPIDGTVFAPGTTSVNVEFTTANLAGGETVDIDVNGTVTTGITSPFAVTTANGQVYNITLNLMDGTTIVDFEGVDFSVGSLTTVADITALRADVDANGVGGFYEITGGSLLTHTDGFNDRKWIQDTTISGVLIFDSAGVITTTYAIGDMITGLKGTTTISYGVIRFIPTEDSGVIASSGNPVVAQTVTIPDFIAAPDDYESELIELENVTFVDGDGVATFATGQNYNLTDDTNTVAKRTDFFGADYIGTIIPSTQLPSVIGVAGEYSGTSQIYLRSLADITLDVVENQIEGFALYPNPVTRGKFTITSNSNLEKHIEIFSVIGKQVYSKRVKSNETVDISNLTSGFYMVRVQEEGKIATRKLIVK